MAVPDLNLLVTLDVLLAEGSVARAARRLRLSPSAMSRALARLRDVTGDPLLVRAGRGLVASPRALELREKVRQLVQDAEAVLRPTEVLDLANLVRTFTIRTSDGFVETFAPALMTRLAKEAPGIRLRFVQKLDRESSHLRDGQADLETGVIGRTTGPEVRAQALFKDRFVGVARHGHQSIQKAKTTIKQYAAQRHVLASRRGIITGPVDDALEGLGIQRNIAIMVSGFGAALAIARETELVATVPERHTASLREGMATFALPFDVAEFTVSMLWHPRMDGDPTHRWLRGCIRDVCVESSR
jgi:DNA-binding transcriptional LysR family regulator